MEFRRFSFLHSSFCVLRSAFIFLLCLSPTFAIAQLIDNFDGPIDWTPHPSDSVTLNISQDPAGRSGAAMRLDFDFHGHAGYAIARKQVSIDLPADYEFSFRVKGDTPPNNLEFKLLDASGDNVWWVNRRNYQFPHDWTPVVLKKRHFEFAWGPAGGGEAHHVAAIEIVVTAGNGGKGSVWIDDLQVNERHVVAVEQPLTFTSSSIDFPEVREFGGMVVEPAAPDYDVQISADTKEWQTVYSVRGARGPRQFLSIPETEARSIRIVPPARTVVIEPIVWSATPNDFFANVARESVRGDFPRYLHGEQSYWTIVGVDGDTSEALINADGAIEPEKGGYSIEPFVFTGGKLVTWNDVQAKQSLARGYIPIPTVAWPMLTITAWASGEREKSTLYVDYTVRKDATLFLAIRPFQVNPSWQFLGVTGGFSPIREIACDENGLHIEGRQPVMVTTNGMRCGVATFDQGNITDWLHRGMTPDVQRVTDPRGHAAGVLAFRLRATEHVTIAVPLHSGATGSQPVGGLRGRRSTSTAWEEKLNRVTIQLPPSGQRIVDTLRASVAYILIHRDGAALQPGSRSYERSWIRDGAMISDALLRLGYADVVRDYIDWYVAFQYPDGKVPCCVDARGADPVPENDSHGELIYLIAEYFRQTSDRALVERVWPHVVSAVSYIDVLRRQRMTAQYANTAFYGLLPESISHEGYSAKPMHSYWDDFFAAKGLHDATFLAEALGRPIDRARFALIRDAFERDLLASIGRAMEMHHIDFIPGSVELGDYDPTSTTIAIAPGNQLPYLPPSTVMRTFDRYFEYARARASGKTSWENYTPYELRTVGTFIRIGQPDRAHELLEFFFRGQRPPGWREWAEVVWRDPKTPKFIGDMPHGWVASDYLRSVLDMFAYDREDGVLVIGTGVRPEWVRESPGVVVRGLHTHEGTLNFTMRGNRVHISGELDARRGILVRLGSQETMVHKVPADVVFDQ